ncbi:MAG: hypothetical protein OXQ30_05925 [Boseongicola sp.]|nr:hypothetical protein [Boseongicola sp.]
MPPAHAAHLLTRQSHRNRGASPITFLGDLTMARARVHELCGGSRRLLALTIAQGLTGTIYWIRPSWTPERLNPDGILRFVDPSRFVFLSPKRPEDLLWTMEETLRAGIIPLVVADLPGPPGLTAIRRLHLAAETGAESSGNPPLGLVLTPGEGGAPGVESRWSLTSTHPDPRTEGWQLARLRARTDTEKQWRVSGAKTGLLLDQVD